MANLLCRTKGNAAPNGKPRVYFTCHPADFEKFFDSVCRDLFASNDCAVYYTEDMTVSLPEETRETDLGRMNLVVVPVTFRLLTQPNRAMDADVPWAMGAHIPVLPLVMEPGLDALYSREDKFGPLQYLEPYTADETAISYREKLKKHLDSVLISDALAKRIRAAFDAYIFLSYRKKDRRYANELMRMIHRNPQYRDIAIWYDEFLTPGESFTDGIERILRDSELFTLLVTPNLLENPNFIMENEYPAAKRAGKTILPAEMVPTDRAALQDSYKEIPECVNPYNEAALLQALQRIAVTTNDEDPEHTFLIGLAYLDGIDMETDKERGVAMITQAAEAELPEAMEKLFRMYREGVGVAPDYRQAQVWCQKWADCLAKSLGDAHPDTLAAMGSLAILCSELADCHKALALQERIHTIRRKTLGRKHPDTLAALNNLAVTCGNLNDYKRALKLLQKAYVLLRWRFGKKHPDTLAALNNLAMGYSGLGEEKRALALNEKVYTLRTRVLGEEHRDTLKSLNNLAQNYSELGVPEKALPLKKAVCDRMCEMLGQEHPDTLTAMSGLATAYDACKEPEKALALHEKVWLLRCGSLGEEHPFALTSLSNMAFSCEDLGDYARALELNEKLYALRYRSLGERHPDTLLALGELSRLCGRVGEYQKAVQLGEQAYQLRREVLSEEHPDTVASLGGLALAYSDLGENEKALVLMEKAYMLHCKVLGLSHPATAVAAQFLDFLRQTAEVKQ